MNNNSIDILKKIREYLPIASVGIACITYALGKKIKRTESLLDRVDLVLFIALGVFIIVFPIILHITFNKIRNYRLLKRNLTNTIIDSQMLILDINNNGKTTNYYEKVIFGKIGKNKNHTSNACMTLGVAGKIKPTSALNCTYNLMLNSSIVLIEYINNTTTLNKYDSLVKKKEKFYVFTAILKKSFDQKIEYWDLIPRHYCREYNLDVLLDSSAVLKSAGIYKVLKNDTGLETEAILHKIPPIISKENGRTKITMYIVDYDYGEKLRLKWEIN